MFRPVDFSVLRLGPKQQAGLPAPGQRLRAEVLRLMPGSRVLLRVGSQKLIAKTTLRLSPRQILTTRVAKSGSTTVLRVDPPDVRATLFRQAEVAQDEASSAVFRAMVRAGTALDPLLLRRLRALFGPHSRPSDEAARLVVEAHRKGIALPAQAVEGPGEGATGDQGGRHGGHRQGAHRASSRGEGSSREKSQSGSETAAPQAIEGLSPTLLPLFNHLSAEDDHWVVLPLTFDERTDWNGSARIRFDRQGRWQEAAIRFDTGSDPAWASISREARAVKLFLPEDATPALSRESVRRAADRLREALSRRGFEALSLHDAKPAEFDGFSTRYSPDIIRPIDEEA